MKVLLATDCSEHATKAAEFVARLNFKRPIQVTIITALGDPYGASPESTQHWFPELLRQERMRAETHQERVAQLLRPRCESVDKICRPGHPVKVILSEAEDLDCDLIVIGARGHSLLGRLLIGSVSDSVATHAKCSVLVVRPDKPASSDQLPAEPGAASTIVVGYDSSKPAREAVEEMAGLEWDRDTKVELVSVAPIYDYLLGNGLSTAAIANEEEIFKEMKKGGEEMTERLNDRLPNTHCEVVHDQRVGDAIVDRADKLGAELIVVGDSGHTLLDDFLLGSTSKYVLRHAACSVWISRAHRNGLGEASAAATAESAG